MQIEIKNKLVLKKSPVPELDFSLIYGRNKPSPVNRDLSYEILSALKREQIVFLEIDSALFLLSKPQESEIQIETLIKDLSRLGIPYRRQTFQTNQARGLLSSLGINKTITTHRVFALIDNETWRQNEFKACLPGNGVRYYICKDAIDEQKIFEDLSSGRLTDMDKRAFFSMNLYDCIEFGQMGIKTDLSKAEIQRLLGI